MLKLLLVFTGAGIGGVLRYWIGGWVQTRASPTFPVGTLAVNLLGCLAIGFLGAALTGPVAVRAELRIAVLVGLLGGFTTFSTFARETLALLGEREYAWAALNLTLSNGLGLLGAWVGIRLAERIYGI